MWHHAGRPTTRDFHRVSGRIFAEPVLQIPAEANRDFIFCKTEKFKGQVAVWSRFENTFRST